MNLNEYQEKARSTATDRVKELGLSYSVIGLAGEAGEVAEKFKKLLRDANGVPTDEFKNELKKELGDVMWYVSDIASTLGFTLDDVAQTNIDKLFSRKARGVLQGSGDNR